MIIPAPETNIGEAAGDVTEVVNIQREDASIGVNLKVESVIENAIGKVTENVKIRLVSIVEFIMSSPGIKMLDLRKKITISDRSLKNDIKTLSDVSLIVHRGSKKTGGVLSYRTVNRIIKTIAGQN